MHHVDLWRSQVYNRRVYVESNGKVAYDFDNEGERKCKRECETKFFAAREGPRGVEGVYKSNQCTRYRNEGRDVERKKSQNAWSMVYRMKEIVSTILVYIPL